MQCVVSSVQCAVFNVQCAKCSVQCAVCIVLCVECSVVYIIYFLTSDGAPNGTGSWTKCTYIVQYLAMSSTTSTGTLQPGPLSLLSPTEW